MEFEQKLKIDVNRPQKVFTAQQVMEGLQEGINKSTEFLADQHPIVSLTMRALCVKLMSDFQVALGIDGPEGAYVDAVTKSTESKR